MGVWWYGSGVSAKRAVLSPAFGGHCVDHAALPLPRGNPMRMHACSVYDEEPRALHGTAIIANIKQA